MAAIVAHSCHGSFVAALLPAAQTTPFAFPYIARSTTMGTEEVMSTPNDPSVISGTRSEPTATVNRELGCKNERLHDRRAILPVEPHGHVRQAQQIRIGHQNVGLPILGAAHAAFRQSPVKLHLVRDADAPVGFVPVFGRAWPILRAFHDHRRGARDLRGHGVVLQVGIQMLKWSAILHCATIHNELRDWIWVKAKVKA